jgi:hypothetical protein
MDKKETIKKVKEVEFKFMKTSHDIFVLYFYLIIILCIGFLLNYLFGGLLEYFSYLVMFLAFVGILLPFKPKLWNLRAYLLISLAILLIGIFYFQEYFYYLYILVMIFNLWACIMSHDYYKLYERMFNSIKM